MKDDATQGSFLRLDPEYLFEAIAEVGVRVIHDQMNTVCLSVDCVEQVLDEGHEVRFGAMVSNQDSPLPTPGFHCHEQIAGAAMHVFIVLSAGVPGRMGKGVRGSMSSCLLFSTRQITGSSVLNRA